MAQLNVEVDDGLIKRVKMACIEDGTNLKKWVSAALEIALDFDSMSETRCRELGWTPSFEALRKGIIDEPPPQELPPKPE